jgi:RNase P/RNase MRP subunit POP5
MTMARRYFLIKIVSEVPLVEQQFNQVMTESVRRYFGEFGLARIDPRVIRFDSQRSEVIVACRKEGAQDLEAAMALISEVSGSQMALLTLRSSGTIKSLRRKKREKHSTPS